MSITYRSAAIGFDQREMPATSRRKFSQRHLAAWDCCHGEACSLIFYLIHLDILCEYTVVRLESVLVSTQPDDILIIAYGPNCHQNHFIMSRGAILYHHFLMFSNYGHHSAIIVVCLSLVQFLFISAFNIQKKKRVGKSQRESHFISSHCGLLGENCNGCSCASRGAAREDILIIANYTHNLTRALIPAPP